MADEKLVGKVTHYYGKLGVAIITLTELLKVGQSLHFKGHGTDFNLVINQMQLDHKDISEGKPGDQVGIKVIQIVHENDQVFAV